MLQDGNERTGSIGCYHCYYQQPQIISRIMSPDDYHHHFLMMKHILSIICTMIMIRHHLTTSTHGSTIIWHWFNHQLASNKTLIHHSVATIWPPDHPSLTDTMVGSEPWFAISSPTDSHQLANYQPAINIHSTISSPSVIHHFSIN